MLSKQTSIEELMRDSKTKIPTQSKGNLKILQVMSDFLCQINTL